MAIIPTFVQNEVESTAATRLSSFNYCNSFDHLLPFADSSMTVSDRKHLLGTYTGALGGTLGAKFYYYKRRRES